MLSIAVVRRAAVAVDSMAGDDPERTFAVSSVFIQLSIRNTGHLAPIVSSMSKSKPSRLVRRLVVGVWTFSVVSVVVWLWIVIGQSPGNDMLFNAATASAIVAGLSALTLGISVAVVRTPLSPNIILTFVAGLAVCAWTGYVWWMIYRIFSGTWPY